MDPRLIRQFADGELPSADAEAVQRAMAADPELQRQVSFERELKAHVARSIGACPAPPVVATTVRSAMAGSAELRSIGANPAEVSRRPMQSERHPRWSIFRDPTRANYFAVAASLALVAGAVLFGVFGPPLLQQRSERGPDLPQLGTTASEAGSEHDRCSTGSAALEARVQYRDLQSIHANLDRRLGARVPVFDLSPVDLALVGAGECGLCPMSEQSVHIVYKRTDRRSRVSLFLQPNKGQFGELENVLETGRVYGPEDFGTGSDAPSCVWSDGALVYVLLACDEQDHAAALKEIMATMIR